MELKHLRVGQKVKVKIKEQILNLEGLEYRTNKRKEFIIDDSIIEDQICNIMFDLLGKIVTIAQINWINNSFL